MWLLGLPLYCPELNPVEDLGDLIKDAVCNKFWKDLCSLEDTILEKIAAIREGVAAVSGMIHAWMRNQANASEPL